MSADDKLCTALAKAKHIGPEIIGLLHSAYHDGYRLADGVTAERIRDARQYAEKLLVAVLAAEQAIAPVSAASPANDVLEAFPDNGVRA